jgi:hypothetical protein
MRVHRLLHETTCRLELTALEKAGAVVDRLTFNATIIETGTESYRPARAKASPSPRPSCSTSTSAAAN